MNQVFMNVLLNVKDLNYSTAALQKVTAKLSKGLLKNRRKIARVGLTLSIGLLYHDLEIRKMKKQFKEIESKIDKYIEKDLPDTESEEPEENDWES